MENFDKKQPEDNKNVCKSCLEGGSCCGMHCGHGFHGGGHHLVKIILKLFIIIIIFWCGFRLGEISGSIRGVNGWGMMNRNNWGMMGGYNYYKNLPSNVNGGTTTPVPVK